MVHKSCFNCPKNCEVEVKEIFVNSKYILHASKIIKIQSFYRGYLIRRDFYDKEIKKEIPMDYSTEKYENNPIIIRLKNLFPKFELTEKEYYIVKNSPNRIIALLYQNNSIYKGMINVKGRKEGFGKLFLSDGSIYKGFFNNNIMEGRGRLLSIDGYIYEGEFKNGKMNGYGKYISLDGTFYKGSWLNDKKNGNGYELYSDTSFYIGNFIDGKKNGIGKMVFKEKNIYEGNFVNNEIDGEGGFYWKDGRTYIGKWEKNKMNGYGIFIWPDKKKYYGNYSNNLKEGFGIFFWSDDKKYMGFWKEGKQQGYGVMSENKIDCYGYWMDGKLKNKIDDKESIKFIKTKVTEVMQQKDYCQFQLSIEKYEKQISDGYSSQDTNSNSKGDKFIKIS